MLCQNRQINGEMHMRKTQMVSAVSVWLGMSMAFSLSAQAQDANANGDGSAAANRNGTATSSVASSYNTTNRELPAQLPARQREPYAGGRRETTARGCASRRCLRREHRHGPGAERQGADQLRLRPEFRRRDQGGLTLAGSTRTVLGSLLVGGPYRINGHRSLNVALSLGVTRDTPDVTLIVRLPMTF